MNIIKTIMTLVIASTCGLSYAQDPNVLVSLNSPAFGVKIKNNFPGHNGPYARAFMLSNQDASADFIGLGVLGNVVDGVSTMTYGYIGTEYNNPIMSFLPNGNVGIGTTSPTSKFDIKGQFNSYSVGIGQQSINTSSRNFVNFGSNNHATVLISSNLYFDGDDNLKIAKSHPTMAGASILIPGNSQPNQGGIVFYTNQPSAVIEDANFTGTMSMIIKNDGNIGIGTVTPAEKLSVNGKIRAKEIKVETANWPDYVFSDEYKKMSLSDLERFINTYKHLPEMPTATEAEREGIDLGRISKNLVKQQEELVLHLVEKDKEIQLLKAENLEIKEQLRRILKSLKLAQ